MFILDYMIIRATRVPYLQDVRGSNAGGDENNVELVFEVVSKPQLRPSYGVRPFLYTSQVFNLC